MNVPATKPSFLPFVTSAYSTPQGITTFMGKRLPSASFYTKLCWFVFSCGIKAKLGRYTGQDWAESSYGILRSLEESGLSFHIEGVHNLVGQKGPFVLIGNHMSTMETLILPSLIQPFFNTTFITKKELVEYPFFGNILRSRDPITLARTNPREDLVAVFQEGVDRLEKGTSIIVFPQSTRSATFDKENFNTIGIKLAQRAQVPVIPFALRTDAWQIGKKIKEFGPLQPRIPVHIAFGAPMQITAKGKEEHAFICSFIQGCLEQWQLSNNM